MQEKLSRIVGHCQARKYNKVPVPRPSPLLSRILPRAASPQAVVLRQRHAMFPFDSGRSGATLPGSGRGGQPTDRGYRSLTVERQAADEYLLMAIGKAVGVA